MSNKTVKILFLIFIILLFAVSYPLWSKYIPNVSGSDKKTNISLEKLVSFDQITSISVKKLDDEITLSKNKDSWKVNDKEADKEKVNQFINDLKEVETIGFASINKENFPEFQVDNDFGYAIKIKFGDKEVNFMVGKPGNQSNTFYIKFNKEDKVYLAKGPIYSQLNTAEISWTKIEPTDEEKN